MRKIKLLTPLAIATLAGTMMPLVSCGCGNTGGQDDPKADYEALCFTDIAGDGIESTVQLTVAGAGDSQVDIDLETSTDGKTWTDWFKTDKVMDESEPITLHDGEHVYVRNKTNKLSYGDPYVGEDCACCVFANTGAINLSGNVNSLINYGQLSDYCFEGLFYENTAIKSIDGLSLPSKTLTKCCYYYMFANCSELTTIPENLLNATTLAEGCYASMFLHCTGLTTIPENLLNANTLADQCYWGMFEDCYSLTNACRLPAKNLANGCYCNLFSQCKSLRIKQEDDATPEQNKIFTCPNYDVSPSPVNYMFSQTGGSFRDDPNKGKTYYWYYDDLCFTDIAGDGKDSTIKIRVRLDGESNVDADLETSKDEKTWTKWFRATTATPDDAVSDEITLHDGEHIYVRNKTNRLSYGGSEEHDPYACFTFESNNDGAINLSGNVNSLINHSEMLDKYCFYSLFQGNEAIKSINGLSLPSLDLTEGCYYAMFEGCSGLSQIPEGLLPSTTLTAGCYEEMFSDCSGLTTIPANLLSNANVLRNDCYSRMFYNCTSLTTACKLPATELVDHCYREMFWGCSSLKIKQTDTVVVEDKFIFTCLSYYCDDPVLYMFSGTDGSFKGTPSAVHTYYWY